MRVSLGVALGSLLLAGAALPVQAGEPVRLAAAELDTITAGAIFGVVGGATGTGAQDALSLFGAESVAIANDRYSYAYGYGVAVGLGVSAQPGNSTANAQATPFGIGDRVRTQTVTVRGGGGFSAWAAQASAGYALNPPQ